MYLEIIPKLDLIVRKDSLPEKSKNYYFSLYNFYKQKYVANPYVSHQQLIETFFNNNAVPQPLDKVIYVYDRAQSDTSIKSLGCYSSYKYNLPTDFIDITDQYTISQYTSLKIAQKLLEHEEYENIFLLFLNSPFNQPYGNIYGILAKSKPPISGGLIKFVVHEITSFSSDTLEKSLEKIIQQYAPPYVYYNSNCWAKKDTYQYESTYEVFDHFINNLERSRALIVNFEQRIKTLAISSITKERNLML